MGLPEEWAGLARNRLSQAGDPGPPLRRNREEDGIQIAVVQYLELLGFFVFSIPNERKASPMAIATLKAMGLRKGSADLGIVVGGRIHFVEVKSATGKLSADQRLFRDDCHDRGIPCGCVRSVDQMAVLLKTWGIVDKPGVKIEVFDVEGEER